MAVRNFQCRYKIYTKKEIDKIIDDLDIDLTNYYDKSEIDTKLADKQNVLTAGTNISISEENIISATGGTEYTAGNNIQISEQNVISATDTVYTAGTGITIDANNVISASGGGEWVEIDKTGSYLKTLFETNPSNDFITAKKDIWFYLTIDGCMQFFIPKGATSTNFQFIGNKQNKPLIMRIYKDGLLGNPPFWTLVTNVDFTNQSVSYSTQNENISNTHYHFFTRD